MKPSTHKHPQFQLNRLIQYGALVTVVVLVVVAPLQILLTIAGAPGGLFICSAFISLFLALPLLMLTTVTPTVTVTTDHLTIEPIIWKSRQIDWQDIQAVMIYPLLPSVDGEITRKYFVGREKYKSAQGIMLVIPSLPMQYRIAGFFAGVRGQPVIALTNRAHSNYETLYQSILIQTNKATHHDDLKAEEEHSTA